MSELGPTIIFLAVFPVIIAQGHIKNTKVFWSCIATTIILLIIGSVVSFKGMEEVAESLPHCSYCNVIYDKEDRYCSLCGSRLTIGE